MLVVKLPHMKNYYVASSLIYLLNFAAKLTRPFKIHIAIILWQVLHLFVFRDFVRGLAWHPTSGDLWSSGWDKQVIKHTVPK